MFSFLSMAPNLRAPPCIPPPDRCRSASSARCPGEIIGACAGHGVPHTSPRGLLIVFENVGSASTSTPPVERQRAINPQVIFRLSEDPAMAMPLCGLKIGKRARYSRRAALSQPFIAQSRKMGAQAECLAVVRRLTCTSAGRRVLRAAPAPHPGFGRAAGLSSSPLVSTNRRRRPPVQQVHHWTLAVMTPGGSRSAVPRA